MLKWFKCRFYHKWKYTDVVKERQYYQRYHDGLLHMDSVTGKPILYSAAYQQKICQDCGKISYASVNI